EEAGMRISGTSPDGNLVEMIELPSHPWFVATQAHPELKSRPDHPHPLFASFVRAATGLPLLTDVHQPDQCAPVAEVVDVLQIPAFLCRQTDLLVAAGAAGRAVNVKKGQWMAPREMRGAAAKVRGAGAPAVAVTERGTFFGYGNLVVDMRGFALLREACDAPAIFDGTHSVQRPGEGGGISGGEPRHIPTLVRAAVAAGCDALFLETHPEPARGLSDTTSMLPLDRLRPLVEEVLALRAALGQGMEAARA
ncbi:MAG TPA: 3-deoxy-8-phosphooctulonate synthase, partial [Longimicrobium sp.]|nr:3-deoxy-8-phosphooctulonate synthase [Longimicrobium sp.]